MSDSLASPPSSASPAGGAARSPRVLVVGLDGATLDLVRPWVEAGELPTLARLFRQGVHGDLLSTVPPITAPAWTSFMTGMNPGRHGLFQFIEPKPGTYEVRYTNARSRLARSIWRLASDGGLKVGVLNVPMTYPPEPVDGFLVSGMDAPEGSRTITHPPELFAELEERFGEVSRQIVYLGYLGTDTQRAELLRTLAANDEHYLRMMRDLLKRRPSDLAMLVFTSTDTVQHFFYQYQEKSHPQHDPGGAARFGGAILDVYRRLDRVIGELEKTLAPGGALVLMSDHGFQPTSGRVLHLNRYLEELGYLVRKGKGGLVKRTLGRLLSAADRVLRGTLSPRQKARLARLLPGLRRRWEAHHGGLATIDWSRTKAYAYEILTTPPGIWINRRSTRPAGIVEDADYEALLRELEEKLRALRDPVTGGPLVPRVYRKEEVYDGPHLGQAPDLTLAWWEGITFISRPGAGAGGVVEYVGDRPVGTGEWGGTHAMRGMVALHGAAFRPGMVLEGARIVDVAPTLLYLLGLPVPDEMDGRVLLEAFRDEFVAARGAPGRAGAEAAGAPLSAATYDDAEAQMVEERLRGLGYLG